MRQSKFRQLKPKPFSEALLNWVSPFTHLFYRLLSLKKEGKTKEGFLWQFVEIKPPWFVHPHFSADSELELKDSRYAAIWTRYWNSLTDSEKIAYLKRWKGGEPWLSVLEKGDFSTKIRPPIEASELFQAPFVEIKPPWAVYPGYPPGDIFWRQEGEPYWGYSWIPYLKGLSQEEKNRYWQRWTLPPEWAFIESKEFSNY